MSQSIQDSKNCFSRCCEKNEHGTNKIQLGILELAIVFWDAERILFETEQKRAFEGILIQLVKDFNKL